MFDGIVRGTVFDGIVREQCFMALLGGQCCIKKSRLIDFHVLLFCEMIDGCDVGS